MRPKLHCCRSRAGFTLVELLVVIAIIGVLVALLLPAVQAAREAARRSSCTNNLKQLAIACHNFHDTYASRLPPGAANDTAPFGTSATAQWGSSWMVHILPYIEQAPLYEKWQFHTHSGYTNANNGALVNNLTIKVFRCPSSAVPDFFNSNGYAARKMVVSYTGISGSAITTGAGTGTYDQSCCNGSGSIAADNGVFHAGSKNGLGSITDGTSNTFLIGEQSAHVRDANGKPVTAGYTAGVGNSGGLYGWTMGASHPANGGQNGWGDGRHFNCTAVRYKINHIGLGNAASSGTNNDVGANFPLSSYHPAGVNMAVADGSVRFFSNNQDLTVIHAFATKSGGESLNAD